jgi:hypothetical protein
VDDEPLTLRDLLDQVTSAMNLPRVGHVPAWLLGLIVGGPLVKSLVTSFRVRNAKAKTELGWSLKYARLRDALPSAVAALEGQQS